MSSGFGTGSENTGAFHHDVYAFVIPGNLGRIAKTEIFDFPSVDNDPVVPGFHSAPEAAVVGIVFEKPGVGVDVEQIVDSHHSQLPGMALDDGLEHLPADTGRIR